MQTEDEEIVEEYLLSDEFKYAIVIYKKQNTLSNKEAAQRVRLEFDSNSTLSHKRDLIEETARNDGLASCREIRDQLGLDIS